MKTIDHLMLGRRLLAQYGAGASGLHRRAFLLGCVEPDYNLLSYLRGLRRHKKFTATTPKTQPPSSAAAPRCLTAAHCPDADCRCILAVCAALLRRYLPHTAWAQPKKGGLSLENTDHLRLVSAGR